MIDILEVAYCEGYNSFPDRDCPYHSDSLEREYWWLGWTQCELTSAYYF